MCGALQTFTLSDEERALAHGEVVRALVGQGGEDAVDGPVLFGGKQVSSVFWQESFEIADGLQASAPVQHVGNAACVICLRLLFEV